MAGVKKSIYREPPTPEGLKKIEKDELEWFDPEVFANYNSGVLEQYFDERNIRKGFYRSKFVWKKVMIGILIGTSFALIDQYVGMKIGLVTSGAWYTAYLVGLALGWDASETNISAGAAQGADRTCTGFVFTFPAIYLLAYSAVYIGEDGSRIVTPESFGPIIPIAIISALLAATLGVMFFIIFRRIWLVEDPLPLPSMQAYVKLIDITNDLSVGAVEAAKRNLRLVFLVAAGTMAFVFFRDAPIVPKEGAAMGQSVMDAGLPSKYYSHGTLWVPKDSAVSKYTLIGFTFEPIQFALGWFLRFRVAFLVGMGSLLSFLVIMPMAVSMDFPVLVVKTVDINGQETLFSGTFAVTDPGLNEVYEMDPGDQSLPATLAKDRVAKIVAIGAILGGGITAFLKMLPVFKTTIGDMRRTAPKKGVRKDWIKGKGWYEWPSQHIFIMSVITFIGITSVFTLGGYPFLHSIIFALILVVFTFVFGAIAVKVSGEIGVTPVSGTSFITLTLLVGIFMLLERMTGTGGNVTFIMALLGTAIFGTAISLSSEIIWDFRIGIYASTRPVHLVRAETIGILFGVPVAVTASSFLSYGLAHGVLDLEAPQAHAFATYVQVLAGAEPYVVHLLLLGFAIGVFMELLTGMGTSFGLGMYLPIWYILPLITGGGLRDYWEKKHLEPKAKAEGWTERQKTMRLLTTYMIATGLMVGAALMGTVIAIYMIIPLFTGG
ncbi:MAG: OPT/YSL family transporter [Thermoplasmata archaeon]|nr:MAG: OPT/YSL family transporter [Thermoplasmata archaeon]